MEKDLISVIIPVYNVEPYLEKCLDSVLNNTYQNIEVICINDGSSDGSLSMLEKCAEKDGRIKIINKENHGVSSARNDGLQAAGGSWISFVDSDDWIHPQFFEVLSRLAWKTDADIVIGSHIRTKESLPFQEIHPEEIRYKKADLNSIYRDRNMKNFVWGKLYRKDVVCGHQFDESISYGEDFLFNAEIYSRADLLNIIAADEVLYYYNDRESSVINTADNADRVRQGKIYIETSRTAENDTVAKICLTEGFKRVLLARYTERYTKNRAEVIAESTSILKQNLHGLWSCKKATAKEKLVYTVFTWFPQAYRYWRIKDDPTMRIWEKNNQKSD